jgi:hypothetical protein
MVVDCFGWLGYSSCGAQSQGRRVIGGDRMKFYMALVVRKVENVFQSAIPGVKIDVKAEPGDPFGFVPVFLTREEAEARHPNDKIVEVSTAQEEV